MNLGSNSELSGNGNSNLQGKCEIWRTFYSSQGYVEAEIDYADSTWN